jgi:flagellar biosynthesis GTPase FlhF
VATPVSQKSIIKNTININNSISLYEGDDEGEVLLFGNLTDDVDFIRHNTATSEHLYGSETPSNHNNNAQKSFSSVQSVGSYLFEARNDNARDQQEDLEDELKESMESSHSSENKDRKEEKDKEKRKEKEKSKKKRSGKKEKNKKDKKDTNRRSERKSKKPVSESKEAQSNEVKQTNSNDKEDR